MMESMIQPGADPRRGIRTSPTRLLDGTGCRDAVAGDGSGEYPVQTVEAMARICVEAESPADCRSKHHFLDRVFTRIDQSIAMAALFAAPPSRSRPFAALTESGSTACGCRASIAGI